MLWVGAPKTEHYIGEAWGHLSIVHLAVVKGGGGQGGLDESFPSSCWEVSPSLVCSLPRMYTIGLHRRVSGNPPVVSPHPRTSTQSMKTESPLCGVLSAHGRKPSIPPD
jgi:hypothetical protein